MKRSFHRRQAALPAVASLLCAAAIFACTSAPPSPPAATPAAVVELAADDLVFDRDVLTVPAEAPFAIRFENREAPPHNVSIHGQGPLFVGELFQGPATRTYVVPALPPGQYTFVCDLHPNMRGTLTSE